MFNVARRSLALAYILISSMSAASAACTSPSGIEGEFQYITNEYRWCNGSIWQSMSGAVTGSTCSDAGKLQYISGDLVFCNTANWVSMNSTITNGSCTGTTAGTVRYNTVPKKMEWCDGTNWKFIPGPMWTWLSGLNGVNQTPVYGVTGTEDAANRPGARSTLTGWVNSAGTYLYLFGGKATIAAGTRGDSNELWRFNFANNQWTFMHGDQTNNSTGVWGAVGSTNETNKPSGRNGFNSAMQTNDSNDNFYAFGGLGKGASGTASPLADLWRWNISSGQWTFVAGSSANAVRGNFGTQGVGASTNQPAGRMYHSTVVDKSTNNVYIFGGQAYPEAGISCGLCLSGLANDLWVWNGTHFIWLKGDKALTQRGIYGTQGTEDSANKPGARTYSFMWLHGGYLYLFGGAGYHETGGSATTDLNDFWRYNISTNNWTWLGGSKGASSVGVPGTIGIGSTSNIPSARDSGSTWVDSSGNLWLYGGYGVNGAGTLNVQLEDLWRYNTSNGEWTRMAGTTNSGVAAIYGTLGVAHSANKPGSREAHVMFGRGSAVYVFGGLTSSTTFLNDLLMWGTP